MSRNLQSQATERDRCLKQINSPKMGRQKRMSKASCIVGRKRKMKWSQQDNLRLMSVNQSLPALEGKDHETL